MKYLILGKRFVLACAVTLSTTLSACKGTKQVSTDIPVRIDPVQLPMAEIPASAIPFPEVREKLLQLVDSLTSDEMFRGANWGILIMDPETSDTIVSLNADKLFMPASNQKLFTGALALDILGQDFEWRTPVVLNGRHSNGVFQGDLELLGSGDPSWSNALRNDSALSVFDVAIDALKARGIKRINGRILASGDVFPASPIGYGWAWDNLDYAYAAGADDLMFNENFFQVAIRANNKPGSAPSISLSPDIAYPTISSSVIVSPEGNSTNNSLKAEYDSTASSLLISGTIKPGQSATFTRAYRRPNDASRHAFIKALSLNGIVFSESKSADGNATRDTIATIVSSKLAVVHERMQKPSQNQIAEALFLTIGREVSGFGTPDSARSVFTNKLLEWRIGENEAIIRDGSGLSRHNYLSPRAIVQLLTVMQSHPTFATFYSSLPIAGVDGTIETRMRSTPASGNLRAKTGTLDKARSLSGYVNTADGHQLVFAMLCNNWTTNVKEVERVQDAIGAYLASVRMQDIRRAIP